MNQDDYDYLFKIVLIGDSGTGKSSIHSRYVRNEFSIDSKSTIGVEFSTKTIITNDKTLKIQIWDTAGQERYRAITNAYYRGSVGIIIVYDITNRTSFYDVEKWRKEVFSFVDYHVPVILLGNKLDQSHLRDVSYQEGKEYATQNNMMFGEVSALNNTNINELLMSFAEVILSIITKVNNGEPITNSPSQSCPPKLLLYYPEINIPKKSCC